MRTIIIPTANRNLSGAGRFFITALVAFALFGCQKEVVNPANTPNAVVAAPINMGPLQIADSKIILLQGNENLKATSFHWTGAANNVYTVEADVLGNNFAEPVELGTTDQSGIDISVKDLNRIALLMIPAGTSGALELRVRANSGKIGYVYTPPTALQLTTYQPYTEYQLPQYMLVPGTYNDWNMTCAPRIVNTHNDGLYEGFINFTTSYTQFLFVKDVNWNPLNTFYNIGNDKIGFKGNIFNIYSGAGVYQLNINTNTNIWACTRINTLGLHGSAVKGNPAVDPAMTLDADKMTWSIVTDLSAGNFRIRANNSNDADYGKTMVNGYLVPDHNGADFTITNPGTYKIVINLKLAGNYTCTVVKTTVS